MKNAVAKCTSFLVAGVMAATVWAAEGPIGSLTVKGEATITAEDSSFTLQDQEYAYFSNDRIQTGEQGEALVITIDGLRVAIGESSSVRIFKNGDAYSIDLENGKMAIDAREGVEYRLMRNGKPVSDNQELASSGDPYVVTAASDDKEAKIYMPAQMEEEEGERRGLLWWLLGGGGAAGYYYSQKDDNGPSS